MGSWMVTALSVWLGVAVVVSAVVLILWQCFWQRAVLTIDPSGVSVCPRRKWLAKRRTVWAPWCGLTEACPPGMAWWSPKSGATGFPAIVLDQPGKASPTRVSIATALWADSRFQSALRGHLRPEQIRSPGYCANEPAPWRVRLTGGGAALVGLAGILCMFSIRYWLLPAAIPPGATFIDALRMSPSYGIGWWAGCLVAAGLFSASYAMLFIWLGMDRPAIVVSACALAGFIILCRPLMHNEGQMVTVLMMILAWAMVLPLVSIGLIALAGRRVRSWRAAGGILLLAAAGVPVGVYLHGGVAGVPLGDLYYPQWTPTGDGFLAGTYDHAAYCDYIWHSSDGHRVRSVRFDAGGVMLVGQDSALARSGVGNLYFIPRWRGDARKLGMTAAAVYWRLDAGDTTACLSADGTNAFLRTMETTKDQGWYEVDMQTGVSKALVIPAAHTNICAMTRTNDGTLLWLLRESPDAPDNGQRRRGIYSVWSFGVREGAGEKGAAQPTRIFQTDEMWVTWEVDRAMTRIIALKESDRNELLIDLSTVPPRTIQRIATEELWRVPKGATSSSGRFSVVAVLTCGRAGDTRAGVVDHQRAMVAPFLCSPSVFSWRSYASFWGVEVCWQPTGNRCLVSMSEPRGPHPWRLMLYDFDSSKSQSAISRGTPVPKPSD